LAETGGENAAERRSTRATPITAPQKKALLELFTKKFAEWSSASKNTALPRANMDKDLDALLVTHGLKRSQASRQLLNFKKANCPELVAVRVDVSAEDIQRNIEYRLGGVESFVSDVLESFEEHRFCVDDDVRRRYVGACRDAVKPHVEALVRAFVDAAAQKGRRGESTTSFWERWFQHNTIGVDEAVRCGLPTELTDRRVNERAVKYRGRAQLIEYASRAVFEFVWGVEVTYAKLLTTANLLAFSGDLVVKIHEALIKHEPTLALFRATIPNGALADDGESRALTQALAGHLLTCYHKMRGRDFVKQVMSNLKWVQRLFVYWRIHRTDLWSRHRSASAAQNRNTHRDRMAAVAAAASNAAAKRAEANRKHPHSEVSSGAGDDAPFAVGTEEEEAEESAAKPKETTPDDDDDDYAPSFFRDEDEAEVEEEEEEEESDLLPSL